MNKRNYRKEYDNYQGTSEQKKRRAQRNKDRRNSIHNGDSHKGDGKDIHHSDKNGLKNPKKRNRSNNRSDNKHHKGEKQRGH